MNQRRNVRSVSLEEVVEAAWSELGLTGIDLQLLPLSAPYGEEEIAKEKEERRKRRCI